MNAERPAENREQSNRETKQTVNCELRTGFPNLFQSVNSLPQFYCEFSATVYRFSLDQSDLRFMARVLHM